MNKTPLGGEKNVAVTSRGDNPQADVYEQFGRTYWLVIYNPETDEWTALDNSENRARKSGAGLATAEILLNAGVVAVLTGETGPKAFRALSSAGISIVHNVSGTVEGAVLDWKVGNLEPAFVANDDGSPDCLLGRIRTAAWPQKND